MRAGFAVAAVVTVLAVTPAEASTPLSAGDIIEAACHPQPVHPGHTVDCEFDLARPGIVTDDGIWLAPQGLLGQRVDDPVPCHVTDERLRCPDFPVADAPTPARTGRLETANGHIDAAINLDVAADQPQLDWQVSHHALVTPTRPLWYWAAGLPDATFLTVTGRYDDHRHVTVPVAGRDINVDGGPGQISYDQLGLPAGTYRAHLCVADGDRGCSTIGRSSVITITDADLLPLRDGHNDPGGDRINLIIAGYGFDHSEQLRQMASRLLTLDGPLLADRDGRLLDQPAARSHLADPALGPLEVHLGLFTIEPFDRHLHRFNLWLLDVPLSHPRALLHTGHATPSQLVVDGFVVDGIQLSNVSVLTLAKPRPGPLPRSSAGTNDLPTLHDEVTNRDADGRLPLSGATVYIDPENPWRAATIAAHELAHALIGLRDEYRSSDSTPGYGYPNCARSRDQAADWWGDHLGDLDPMAHTWRDLMARWQPHRPAITDDQLADWFGVGYHTDQGCASNGDHDTVVPHRRGLMASDLPVLGTVNRTRVERILNLFDGSAPAPPSVAGPPVSPVAGPAAAAAAATAGTVATVSRRRRR